MVLKGDLWKWFEDGTKESCHVLVSDVPPRGDRGALRQPLEVGHGAVDGARVHPLPGRVRGFRAVPVDDLVLILTRGFPPLSVQQEEVDDLLGVVAGKDHLGHGQGSQVEREYENRMDAFSLSLFLRLCS